MQVTGKGAIIGFDRPTQLKNERTKASTSSADESLSSSFTALASQAERPSGKSSAKAEKTEKTEKAEKAEKAEKKSSSKSQSNENVDVQSFESVLANTAKQSSVATPPAQSEEMADDGEAKTKRASLSAKPGEMSAKPGEMTAKPGEAQTQSASAAVPLKAAADQKPLSAQAAIQAALLGQKLAESSGDIGGDANQAVDAQALLGELQDVVGSESALRQNSMQLFLDRMQTEFGIEPGKIVKAFSNLDDRALQATPDQTAESVLAQLELKPEQMPKAERYYREMLLTTGESALNEQLAGIQIGNALGVSVKVLSEKDEATRKLEQSIASLNDSFAMRQSTKEVGPPQTAPATAAETAAVFASSASSPSDATGSELTHEKTSKYETIAQALSAAVAAPTSGPLASGADSNSSSGSSSRQAKPQAGKAVTASALEKTIEDASLMTIPTAGGERAAVPLAAGSSSSAALAQVMLKQGDAGAPENVQDLVRNAQLLVQKGGGEMRMQLRPEGLGEVHLKVTVKEGQVGIQMLTDSDSAKRALEKGLDDLKTNLASHRLQVEALKVDVSTDLAKQRFEQGNQESARDQARQMAQDFMGQFRQDREGFRQGFTEGFGMGSYQQPRRQPVPEAEAVATPGVASVAKARSAATGGDRRLNLVA